MRRKERRGGRSDVEEGAMFGKKRREGRTNKEEGAIRRKGDEDEGKPDNEIENIKKPASSYSTYFSLIYFFFSISLSQATTSPRTSS